MLPNFIMLDSINVKYIVYIYTQLVLKHNQRCYNWRFSVQIQNKQEKHHIFWMKQLSLQSSQSHTQLNLAYSNLLAWEIIPTNILMQAKALQ